MNKNSDYIFQQSHNVTFKDLTVFGNVYFANYFLWQGEVREEMLKQLLPKPKLMIDQGLRLITIEASMKYTGHLGFGDSVTINVKPTKISMTTVELLFIFTKNDTDEIVAEGSQKIGFAGKDGVPCPLPLDILTSSEKHLKGQLLEDVKNIKSKIEKITSKTGHA